MGERRWRGGVIESRGSDGEKVREAPGEKGYEDVYGFDACTARCQSGVFRSRSRRRRNQEAAGGVAGVQPLQRSAFGGFILRLLSGKRSAWLQDGEKMENASAETATATATTSRSAVLGCKSKRKRQSPQRRTRWREGDGATLTSLLGWIRMWMDLIKGCNQNGCRRKGL